MTDPRDIEILPPDPQWQPPHAKQRVYDVLETPPSSRVTLGSDEQPAPVKMAKPVREGDPRLVAKWARWAIRLYLLAVTSALLIWLLEPFGPAPLDQLRVWLDAQHGFGQVLVVLALAAGCPLFLPVGPLAMIPGFLYGTMEGTALALIGSSLGGLVNFYLARWYLEPHVHAWLSKHPVPAQLYRTMDQRGGRIALGLRMTPYMHYGVLGFLCGLTTMRWWTFVPLMALGGLPWTSVWAHVGHLLRVAQKTVTVREGLQQVASDPNAWLVQGLGLGLLVALALWIGRLARADLAKATGSVKS